jgi:hypothetical protein
MRKSTYLPLLSAVLGVVGFALRRWAVNAAFESDTGLAIAGHPAILALIGLTVLAVILLAVLCQGSRQLTEEECPLALAGADPFALILSCSAGFLTILAGCAAFLDLLTGFQAMTHYDSGVLSSLTPLLLGAFALVSGVCMLILARQRYQRGQGESFSFLPLIPAFFTCFWLIDVYRVRASDPVILGYAWFFLAVIALTLALYCSAGFAFRNGKPFMALYWSMLSVVFILTTAADEHALMDLLLLAAGALWCLAQSRVLLRNLEKDHLTPPAPETPSDTGNNNMDSQKDHDNDDDDDVDIIL